MLEWKMLNDLILINPQVCILEIGRNSSKMKVLKTENRGEIFNTCEY